MVVQVDSLTKLLVGQALPPQRDASTLQVGRHCRPVHAPPLGQMLHVCPGSVLVRKLCNLISSQSPLRRAVRASARGGLLGTLEQASQTGRKASDLPLELRALSGQLHQKFKVRNTDRVDAVVATATAALFVLGAGSQPVDGTLQGPCQLRPTGFCYLDLDQAHVLVH